MTKGVYFNIQRYCLHDGPGIRTTVFLKGCPLKCIWCHNPESQSREAEVMFYDFKCHLCGKCLTVCENRTIEADLNVSVSDINANNAHMEIRRENCEKCGKCEDVCPYEATRLCGKEISAEDVVLKVESDKLFYGTSGGGMTVSGGEPAFQSEFTLEVLRLAKEKGIDAAVETCGFGSRSFYEKAADMGTLFLFDLKEMDGEKHLEYTGVSNKVILDNLEYLFSRKADVIIRMPLIPGINDGREDIRLLADYLVSHKGMYRYAEIMPYHNLGNSKLGSLGRDTEMLEDIPTDGSSVDMWLELFKEFGLDDVKVSR